MRPSKQEEEAQPLPFYKKNFSESESLTDPPSAEADSFGTGMRLLLTRDFATHSVETFYFAANMILTRPEVIWKHVYTSYLTAFNAKNSEALIMKDESLSEEADPRLFFDVTRGSDVEEHFLRSGKMRKVELERVWVLDSRKDIHVVMNESWDFDNSVIRFGPKKGRDPWAEEAEYKKLIPLVSWELRFTVRGVSLSAYGIDTDDLESGFDSQAAVSKIAKIFQGNSLETWRGTARQFVSHPTLLHVDRKNYLHVYQTLKKAQSVLLKQIWEKLEINTNAEKFIAEDLHIATYLDRLQANPTSPIKFEKKFVDIGCGNGLLTYLLTQMGWLGYGIDLRRRTLWDEFAKANTELKECHIAYNTTLPMVDSNTLLIGNHPDELTCLVPFLAAKCKAAGFIVIPCCAFDIFGRKLVRRNSKTSVFDNHIRALIKWSSDLGFGIGVDKLRIPSTKRIAILGSTPSTRTEESIEVFENYWSMFESTVTLQAIETESKPFKPSVNAKNISSIVDSIFSFILRGYYCREKHEENICHSCLEISKERNSYNPGCQRVTIQMIVDHLSEIQLRSVKALRGNGLFTILRSFPDTFKIEDGYIRILVPHKSRLEKLIQDGKGHLSGTKRCIWYDRHPDKCPLKASQCAYAHCSSEELSQSMVNLQTA